MNTTSTTITHTAVGLIMATLLSVAPLLFSASLSFADHDSYNNPYTTPFNNYPDGSSRPLNPGPGGRWNDDEYNTRKQQEQERYERSRRDSYNEPPAYSGPRDFNVWKDGKSTLCTQTKRDVYCY